MTIGRDRTAGALTSRRSATTCAQETHARRTTKSPTRKSGNRSFRRHRRRTTTGSRGARGRLTIAAGGETHGTHARSERKLRDRAGRGHAAERGTFVYQTLRSGPTATFVGDPAGLGIWNSVILPSSVMALDALPSVCSPSSTSGEVTEHALPNANSGPTTIALAPDGTLWFTESQRDDNHEETARAHPERLHRQHHHR